MKTKQNEDIYRDIMSGRSIIQMYQEMKKERDEALAKLAATKILLGASNVETRL